MTDFGAFEHRWWERQGSLRTVVRHHVIAEQLRAHTAGLETVLDVGCGQGTQALELAARGHRVTGIDPSRDLLGRMTAEAADRGLAIEALLGTVQDVEGAVGGRLFDLVCAHGLLMYLDDPRSALASLAARTRRGGLVSFTVRNGDALALRPGLRGDVAATLRAFDTSGYVNELGARATAHRLAEVLGWCEALGLAVEQWYGVRVLTDARDAAEAPDPATLADWLTAEVEAGRRDPYRRIASQLHVVCRR